MNRTELPFEFEVQAHTSRDGQIWSTGSSQCQVVTHTHTRSGGQTDTVIERKFCATNPSTPFNGGWINVYGVDPDNVEWYLAQVSANLSHTQVDYIYPGLRFKPVAIASGLQSLSPSGDRYDCIFEYFDGYSPGVNSIVVTPPGPAPLAHFACFKRNPPNP